MPATQRRIDPGVAQQLLAAPHRFGFFQAVRILERVFARQGMRPGDALARMVRFRNSTAMAFPAAELESIQARSTDGTALERPAAAEHALQMEDLGSVQLVPAFMGMLGGQGVLPLHYTETLAARETYQRDHAPRAFLDIFSNRAVALHYAAWKKHRLAIQYELDGDEKFLPLVLALSGLGMASLRGRLQDGEGDVFDQSIAHHAGSIRQRPVSAAVLQRTLSSYFRVPLRVEQFIGAWYPVPETQRTRLGVGNAALGSTALAGERVWQRDLRVCLWVGPLRRREFDAFLPGGAANRALSKWLALLTGSSLEYRVRLVLAPDDLRGIALGGDSEGGKTGEGAGARLGFDSYLCSRPATGPRSDTCYEVQALH